MNIEDEALRHAPALGGVIAATLLKLKEGWRVMLTHAAAGTITVLVLRTVPAWLASTLHVPVELGGFFLGGLGIITLQKLAETVQALEIARPVNAFIERWTGAKAPPPQEPKP